MPYEARPCRVVIPAIDQGNQQEIYEEIGRIFYEVVDKPAHKARNVQYVASMDLSTLCNRATGEVLMDKAGSKGEAQDYGFTPVHVADFRNTKEALEAVYELTERILPVNKHIFALIGYPPENACPDPDNLSLG